MNRPIRTLAVGFLVLFLGLLGRATYVQFFEASSLSSVTDHPNNVRAVNDEFSRQRGTIIVGGKPIAVSNPIRGVYKYQRTYPFGPEYAQITGYFSLGYGLGGIEASQNKALSGEDDKLFLRRLSDVLENKPTPGENVVLTLNAAAQRAAYQGLRGKVGSVVAIEPSTGRILAMMSTPTYNPNNLAVHDASKVSATKNRLLNQRPSPLDNAAIQSIVPPGSTFKLVTAAAALSSGRYNPNTLVPGVARMRLPQSTRYLTNENGFACGGLKVTLTVALERSCNVAFGTVGGALGVKALNDQAAKFGFGQTYFSDLDDGLVSQAASNFPTNADAPGTVLAAIGQGNVAATPLQMALVAAGIANNGVVMAPYLVSEIDAGLNVASHASPHPINDLQPAVSPTVAQELTQMMVKVVQNGTGTPAQIPGIQVAGKTGTAQSAASRPPYAWFVSFAPADNPKVAVAVLIQDGGVNRNQISGAGLAAPIAKAVMQAVLGS
ncbi:MAG: peptidoglycan D,D-transpeptidase FtsI family protein [Marmoricola sp.]